MIKLHPDESDPVFYSDASLGCGLSSIPGKLWVTRKRIVFDGGRVIEIPFSTLAAASSSRWGLPWKGCRLETTLGEVILLRVNPDELSSLLYHIKHFGAIARYPHTLHPDERLLLSEHATTPQNRHALPGRFRITNQRISFSFLPESTFDISLEQLVDVSPVRIRWFHKAIQLRTCAGATHRIVLHTTPRAVKAITAILEDYVSRAADNVRRAEINALRSGP